MCIRDRVREQHKGDVVQIRAILEFSNVCRRACRYCGLNCYNGKVARYRMEPDEMIEVAYACLLYTSQCD